MAAPAYDHLFKLLLVGSAGAGKSSLLLRYCDDTFKETLISSIGIDFKIKTVEIDGKKLKLQIWDTAGQERFRTITSAYYRGAHGILVTNSLEDADAKRSLSTWFAEVERYAAPTVEKLLVFTKSDLSSRVITPAQVTALSEEFSVPAVETSAKTGSNVTEAFMKLATALLQKEQTKAAPTATSAKGPVLKGPVARGAVVKKVAVSVSDSEDEDESEQEESEEEGSGSEEEAASAPALTKAGAAPAPAKAPALAKAPAPPKAPVTKSAAPKGNVALHIPKKPIGVKVEEAKKKKKEKKEVEKKLRVVVLGDPGCGKTAFLTALCTGTFGTHPTPACGEEFTPKIPEDNEDLAGWQITFVEPNSSAENERLRLLSYAGADAFIVCYSKVNPQSFARVSRYWLPSIRQSKVKHPHIAVVELQADLVKDSGAMDALIAQGKKPVQDSELSKLDLIVDSTASVIAKVPQEVIEKGFELLGEAADRKRENLSDDQNELQVKVDVSGRDPHIQRQVLDLGDQLAAKKITFEEWDAQVKELVAEQKRITEERRRALTVFAKIDEDNSGTIEKEEFRQLTEELGGGEEWTEDELDHAFRSIDVDESGSIDFEEFYSWWSSPDTHALKASMRSVKLSTLRTQAKLRTVKANSARIASSLGAAARYSQQEGTTKPTKIDLSVTVGNFEAQSGVDVSLITDEQMAEEVRARIPGTDKTSFVVSFAFGIKKDVELFSIGELSGLIKEGLRLLQKQLKFTAIHNDVVGSNDQHVFRVSLSFDPKSSAQLREIESILSVIKDLTFSVNFAEKPGTVPPKGAAGKFSAALNAELRTLLAEGVDSIFEPADDDEEEEEEVQELIKVKGDPFLALQVLRQLEGSVKFDDIDGVLPPGAQLFRILRGALLLPIAGKPGADTVVQRLSLLDTLDSIAAVAGDRTLLLTGRNMTLFDLVPSLAEFYAAKEDSDTKNTDAFELFIGSQLRSKPDDDEDDDVSEDEGLDEEDAEEEEEEEEEEVGPEVVPGMDDVDDTIALERHLDWGSYITASVAKAPSAAVSRKGTNWQIEPDEESVHGSVLQLIADKEFTIRLSLHDVPPGDYMPFARVKFHFDANVSDLNTELKYFKVDEDGDADEETIDGSFDEEAQKKVRDNLWHEIPLSAQFIPVKKSTDVKFTIEAQPRHGDWANGFSIDWIGLRPLLLPPRVRRMAEEGICSRKDGLSEVWKVKKDDDIKDYCGACVKHCLPAEAENLGTAESRFDVFDCACFESGDCKCAAVPPPPDFPRKLVVRSPVYTTTDTVVRMLSNRPLAVLACANVSAPRTALTYFEVHIDNGGPSNEIGIGLVDKKHALARMFPGWRHHSFGLHGDNGKIYFGRGSGRGNTGVEQQSRKHPYSTGDVVGCGYDPLAKQVFFTLNGSLLEPVASQVPPKAYLPCVALRGVGTQVSFNFGDKPFSYDAKQKWTPLITGSASLVSAAPVKKADSDE